MEIFSKEYINGDFACNIYTLINKNGNSLKVSSYGCTILEINVEDKNGDIANVVTGYDDCSQYQNDKAYMGACIGRCANRISYSSFILNGELYKLPETSKDVTLHGGLEGFNKKQFTREPSDEKLILTYLSKDMESGFPGNLLVTVSYHFSDDNVLTIEYLAKSDKDTVVNLTNHSYFNLSAFTSSDIEGHILYINADKFTEINELLLPTGNIIDVENTPFDFTIPKKIGKDLYIKNNQLALSDGYDHNFILNSDGNINTLSAKVVDKDSGRVLEMYTTKPAVQLYTGNMMNNILGKNGIVYNKRAAFCLETQHYPDAINHKNFPSPILKANDIYNHKTIYKFSVE